MTMFNLPFLFDSMLNTAVVPVFVNAGAALLPALLAGLASALALLFKPKELIRVCRNRPHVPLIVVVSALLLFALIRWMDAPDGRDEARGRTRIRRQRNRRTAVLRGRGK